MQLHEIQVSLGERSYPIYTGREMSESLGSVCRKHNIPNRLVVVTDRNVGRLYLKKVQNHLGKSGFDVSSFVLPPGEGQKNLATASRLYTFLLNQRVGRSAGLLALGGGVVGDLAGFVAATYQRGITLIQMPTTLLSQVDSSVGGKTGVNHPLGKNMIGAFYHPSFVWADASYLSTLPRREIICGLGEIIKYGVILDRELFAFLEAHLGDLMALEGTSLTHVQNVCCSLKAGIVSSDERESGIRAVLNYGHTVGHGLEAAGKYGVLSHGEAVLLGMIAESYIARELKLLPGEIHEKIVRLIRRVPLRYKKESLGSSGILKAMGRDKKSNDGALRFALPIGIGEMKVVGGVPTDLVKKSLQYTFAQAFAR